MNPKPIQIAVAPHVAGALEEALYALCHDGSIWLLDGPRTIEGTRWYKLPEISAPAEEWEK